MSYFKFDDEVKTIRFTYFRETYFNPIWITDDGTFMIGCQAVKPKFFKGRCYKYDIQMEPYSERGVIGVSYRASLSNLVEDVNDNDDDDPFM